MGYINRGNNNRNYLVSKEFNVDNGAGTTDDDLLGYLPEDFTVVTVKRVYTEATDSSMGAPTTKVGTAVGGEQIVTAKTVPEGAAVSSVTDLTLVTDKFAGGQAIWVRHTGVATTQAGKYKVVVEYEVDP